MAIRQTEEAQLKKAEPSVRTDRSFALYVVLSALTLSIYHYIFLEAWVKDLNVLCKEDGERTRGIGEMLLLSILTLGVYKYVWIAGIADRIYNNADRYDVDVWQDGESFCLWMMLVPVVGYFIAMYLAIRDTNRLAAAYAAQKQKKSSAPQKVRPDEHSLPSEQGTLTGLAGSLSGTKIVLEPGQTITIGRSAASASLIVEGPKISRLHCIVQYNGRLTGYTVTDRSSNGVLLNGKRIRPNQPTYAAAGTVIALADGANKFQLL